MLATRTITPGIERSIPPVMITSISPSPATARNVTNGRIPLEKESFDSVSGAMTAAITNSAPVASQTGTNPAPISRLLTSDAMRESLPRVAAGRISEAPAVTLPPQAPPRLGGAAQPRAAQPDRRR